MLFRSNDTAYEIADSDWSSDVCSSDLDAELSELSIDASIVQAHQHSAGAKKGGHPTKSDTVAVEQVQKSMPL